MILMMNKHKNTRDSMFSSTTLDQYNNLIAYNLNEKSNIFFQIAMEIDMAP